MSTEDEEIGFEAVHLDGPIDVEYKIPEDAKPEPLRIEFREAGFYRLGTQLIAAKAGDVYIFEDGSWFLDA